MIEAHSVEAVRRAESVAMAELPSGALMQRAAAGLAAVIVRELRERAGGVYAAKVVLLIGPGANGGDTLYAGARLAARGASVMAILTAAKPHAEGLAALLAAGGRSLDIVRQPTTTTVSEVDPEEDPAVRRLNALKLDGAVGRAWTAARTAVLEADVIVDGLLGIGGRPGLTDSAARIVNALDPRVPVIAVDTPSGINPDTGAVLGTHVNADLTVTFGTAKPGLLLPPAAQFAGRVELVDIGLDPAYLGPPVVQRVAGPEVAALWPVPHPTDDKYSRGVVGVVAGGSVYTGAAVLACGAAIRSGAGMVRFVGPETVTAAVRNRWPEVVPGEGRVQAWVLGPGVDPDRDDDQAAAIARALAGQEPCLVDAGGVGVLARLLREGAEVNAPLLLTPHAGELAALASSLGEAKQVSRETVVAQPLVYARQAARETSATVLLKGAVTIVADADGTVDSQAEAPSWLATAGAGDVLSGIGGALLGAGLSPFDAASMAAWLHGTAAARASDGGPISAGDVLAAIPGALRAALRRQPD